MHFRFNPFNKKLDLVNTPDDLEKAIGAEIDAGIDNSKYVTPKAIADSDLATETYADTKLALDQTTPETITNGFPLYEDGHAAFTDQHQLVDKEYVDSAVATIGARFFMLDAADGTVATYKQTSNTASALATANVSASVNAATDTIIEEWISPSDFTFESLEAGVYDLNIFAARTAGNRDVRVFWRFYERLADTSEVLIATSNLSEIVTTKTRLRVYATLSSDYTPSVGSRLVGKVYFNTVGGTQNTTCVLYYQGDEDSHWQIPVNQEFLDDNYLPRPTSDGTSGQILSTNGSNVTSWVNNSFLNNQIMN